MLLSEVTLCLSPLRLLEQSTTGWMFYKQEKCHVSWSGEGSLPGCRPLITFLHGQCGEGALKDLSLLCLFGCTAWLLVSSFPNQGSKAGTCSENTVLTTQSPGNSQGSFFQGSNPLQEVSILTIKSLLPNPTF